MLISDAYRAQNAKLHATIPYYGSKGSQWAAYVAQLIREDGHASVLDYGCGKGSLARTLDEWGYPCAEYDPAVDGKDAPPAPADLVVCTDVLEHIEPEYWESVLADLARVTRRKLFFDVCTEPAVKTLDDGRNAHLMVHDPDWWREQLSRYFDVTVLVDRSKDARFIYGEAVPKGVMDRQPDQPRKRRRLTPEMSAFFEQVRRQTRLHSDGMSQINSIAMFEGVEDTPADMQVICDNLDLVDPMPQLRAALKLTRKVMLIRSPLGERSEKDWRDLLETFLRVFDWRCEEGQFVCVGSPSLKVGNVQVVGARPSDERWGQVKAACARISKRVTPSKPHGRTAVIACYGPSLRETIDKLAEEAADKNCDVISVSGAHDFLIASGVCPTYHVECDPRAHKADNIEHFDERVQYLIGSGCSPVLFDKLERADVALWHIATPEHVPLFFNELKEPGNIVISGGGSVGVRAVSLLYTMGYRKFSIHGMDCSFADDGMQWAGKHAGKRQDVVKATVGGREFFTSLVLLTYATDFLEMVQKVEIDAELWGDGLLQSMCMIHAKMAEAA